MSGKLLRVVPMLQTDDAVAVAFGGWMLRDFGLPRLPSLTSVPLFNVLSM